MLLVEAEALVGLPVLDARGDAVGVVVDVGLGERRFPKFLLVGAAGGGGTLRRVEARDVALEGGAVRLRA